MAEKILYVWILVHTSYTPHVYVHPNMIPYIIQEERATAMQEMHELEQTLKSLQEALQQYADNDPERHAALGMLGGVCWGWGGY